MSPGVQMGAASLLGIASLVGAAGVGGAVARAGEVAHQDQPRRIVALAPSVTETLWALGVGRRVVGVCAQCDHPPAARATARVGGYLSPSLEAVVGLAPDLVVAVPSPGNREAVRGLERLGVEVLVVQDRTLRDLWASMRAIGARVGRAEAGAALATRLERELADVRAMVAGRPRPRTLLVVGHRPLVVAGNDTLQGELLEIAGAENLARSIGGAWPTLSLEVALAHEPDVILDAAMGSEDGARTLFGRGDRPRVVHVPLDTLLRAGPRVADAARLLAARLHEARAP